MRTLQVYGRQGCHLCELLVEELVPLLRGRAAVDVLDVDKDPALQKRYGRRVPVVVLEGRVLCTYRLDRRTIEEALEDGPGDERENEPS